MSTRKGISVSQALVLLLASDMAHAAPMAPAVEIVELAEQPVLVTLVRAKPADLQDKLTSAYFTLLATTQKTGLAINGAPFARYVSRGTAKDPTMVVEAGIVVRGKPTAALPADVKLDALPAGPAVVLDYKGRRENLGTQHSALDAWLASEKRKPAGARWEIYVTNPITTPDPAAQQTRIVAPLRKQ